MIPTVMAKDRGFDPERLARVDDWMQSYVDAGKFPGASILIARSGGIVHHHATGLRDIDAGLPFERDTVARIYSMTKPIVSVGLMMLIERGLFTLDTPVSEFIPGFATPRALVAGATSIDQTEPCAPPTLHQLMTHTAGLSYGFNPGVLAAEMQARHIAFPAGRGTLETAANEVATLPLAFVPGTRWEYSVAIDIIGRVIEVASGQPLDRYLAEQILDPLGMTETAFSVPPHARDRFAALYSSIPGGAMALEKQGGDAPEMHLADAPATSPFLNATTFSGGGGLVGTIDDYLRFSEMLRLRGALGDMRLLSPQTVDFMMRNHLPGDIASMGQPSFAEQPMEGMGFGLGGAVVLDPALARTPGHVGDFSWGGIASTFFWIDRRSDLSVVFFTQLSPSSSYPARSELKALVLAAMVA